MFPESSCDTRARVHAKNSMHSFVPIPHLSIPLTEPQTNSEQVRSGRIRHWLIKTSRRNTLRVTVPGLRCLASRFSGATGKRHVAQTRDQDEEEAEEREEHPDPLPDAVQRLGLGLAQPQARESQLHPVRSTRILARSCPRSSSRAWSKMLLS